MSENNKLDIAQWVVEQTLKEGANEASANISKRRNVSIDFRDKKIEELKEATQNSLNLDIYTNHKYSSHSTNDLRKETLKKFIGEAVAATKYLTEDEFRSLPDPKYYSKKPELDLQLLDPNYNNVESKERVQIAREIEDAAMAVSDKIISTTSGYSDSTYDAVKVHSNGFSGNTEGTQFWAGASVTVRDGETGRPSDWYWGGARFRKELLSPEYLGQEAARRALRKIGQKKIESGKYKMVVENRVGGRLLGMLQYPMTARALQQKRSFLEGMLNKQIASEKLTITDDPFLPKGFNSRFFDGEGISAKKRTMIEKGILKNYYVDNYYGKKLGMDPTSGSSSNVVFQYGIRSYEEMIKDLENGILVTSFIGGNSNSTTGDFSFGVVGLFVENGEAVQPINEMNISGNSKEFWKNLVEVGNDPYPFSSRRIPGMMFEDVQFSGL